MMRIETAIKKLMENYERAKTIREVNDKVAWALYQTWREADEQYTRRKKTKVRL